MADTTLEHEIMKALGIDRDDIHKATIHLCAEDPVRVEMTCFVRDSKGKIETFKDMQGEVQVKTIERTFEVERDKDSERLSKDFVAKLTKPIE